MSRFEPRFVLAFLALLALPPCGAAMAADAVPALPRYEEFYRQLPLPNRQNAITVEADGTLSWLGKQPVGPCPDNSPYSAYVSRLEITRDRWNPATGAIQRAPLKPPLHGNVQMQLPLPAGLLAVLGLGDTCPAGSGLKTYFVFFPATGAAPLTLKLGDLPDSPTRQLLPLGDDAAALVFSDKEARIQVRVIRRQNDALTLEVMPALAIANNYRGYAVAVAGADQLMILGGASAKYAGCSLSNGSDPCRAETHVLDLKAKRWRDGPSMLEARTDLAASALPDGSILVTGGWTRAANWQTQTPSRTAELWNPATDQFEPLPPMPGGNARHKHIWWTAPWGRTLLVTQGIAGVAYSFDPDTRIWRTVGQWPAEFSRIILGTRSSGGEGFFPFALNGNAYAWLLAPAGEMPFNQSISLTQLHPPAEQPSSASPPGEMFGSFQLDAAFLPATATAPALVLGGGDGAALAVGLDGRMVALPAMLHARNNARAFRVAGGVLALGGTDPARPGYGRDSPKPQPAEWLPPQTGAPWQWREVGGEAVNTTDTAITQLKDGSLLMVEPTGNVRQLRLVMREGGPVIESQPHSRLNRERRHSGEEDQKIKVRALSDGRLIVAGGVVRSELIALYSERALQPDQPDEYIPIGDFLPWRRYEIFDPATRRWSNSAPSQSAGGMAAILGDGRVAKVGEIPQASGAEDNGQRTYVLEISDPSGARWSTMTRSGLHLIVDSNFRLFSLDDELFAFGATEYIDLGHIGNYGRRGVEWLNPATGQWELLWQGETKDFWNGYQGLLLRRTLTGADGKTKTLIIPAGGF